jgi:hypothetical protein
MNKLLSALFAVGLSSYAQAQESITYKIEINQDQIQGDLNGKSYCRKVTTGGIFGQPIGKGNHCISFSQTTANDNANTFFGNPPEDKSYLLASNLVILEKELYVLTMDKKSLVAVQGAAQSGVVFKLQKK